MSMSLFYYLLYRVHRSENVAHVGHTHYFCALVEQIFELIETEFTLLIHGYHAYGNAFFSRLELPRHNVRVMLHDRNNDLIAFRHELVAEGTDHQIQCLGSAAGEDNLLCLPGIDKLPHRLARRFVQVGGLLREVMNATMHVGIHVKIFVSHGIKHAQRLLCRCSIVEIDQRPVVNRTGKDRKILTDSLPQPLQGGETNDLLHIGILY